MEKKIESNLGSSDNCIKVNAENLEFELCAESGGITVKHKGKEVQVDFKDFENVLALRAILHQEFDYNLLSPINGKIALILQGYLNQLLARLKGEEYTVCIKFINGDCAGEYIIANKNGIFIRKTIGKSGVEEDTLISSLKIMKIEGVRFNGLNVDLGVKFVKITTTDGNIITGSVDEVTTHIKSIYGLKKEEEFKILLNNAEYGIIEGYYAVGPWFDGQHLTIATESLYNPPWKKVEKYELPPQVNAEKKREVLKRILGTVNSYRARNLVTWILSFGAVANFAHYLRQKAGFFPHVILIGDRYTGKTTLTELNKYLYWGNNWFPEESPKTEAQLRRLLSQWTLVTPIEEWNELEIDSIQVREMLNLLHDSAQRFVLRKITGSNPDIIGTFLSLSSVIGDTNYSQEIRESSADKIRFQILDKEEGIDLSKAKEYNALLKGEMVGDTTLHTILHSIGIELLQIVSEKLRFVRFNDSREGLMQLYIRIGYESWIEIFRRYGIKLTPTVQGGFEEFPYPEERQVIYDTEEDLEDAFYQYIYERIRQYGTIPLDRDYLPRFNFYFEGDEVVCNRAFLSQFSAWLEKNTKMRGLGVNMLVRKLGLIPTSRSYDGKKIGNLYKKKVPLGLLRLDESQEA